VAGDERLTFADLYRHAQQLATALVGAGIRKGDRVGIAMRNCPAWIVSYMAILEAGGIATLLNGWWQADEMRHALELVEPKLVIADPGRAKKLEEGCGGCRIVSLPIERALPEALAPLLGGPEGMPPPVMPDDDATILFTSGSTGLAKGAVSTHRAVTTGVYAYSISLAVLRGLREGAGEAVPEPRTLINVPLFHVTGEVPQLLNSFVIGRTMVLMPKWDAGEALRLIEKEKITYFVGVPTMSLELMQHPDRDKYDLSGQLRPRPAGARLWPDRDQRGRLRQFLDELSRQAGVHRPGACADRRARHFGRRRCASPRRRTRRDRDPLGRQHPRLLA
jgi:long-chain acyl-CoA synthetase